MGIGGGKWVRVMHAMDVAVAEFGLRKRGASVRNVVIQSKARKSVALIAARVFRCLLGFRCRIRSMMGKKSRFYLVVMSERLRRVL